VNGDGTRATLADLWQASEKQFFTAVERGPDDLARVFLVTSAQRAGFQGRDDRRIETCCQMLSVLTAEMAVHRTRIVLLHGLVPIFHNARLFRGEPMCRHGGWGDDLFAGLNMDDMIR